MVTTTTLRAPEYGDAPLPLVARLGFTPDDYRRAGGVAVIRCAVMDPLRAMMAGRADLVEGFAGALRRELHAKLAAAN